MLQAFVSLKHQQPPRTESGLQSFFEALASSSYSDPTYFCTNVDATPVEYSVEALTQACMHKKCKFAVIRGGSPYWQATVLMPDKKGLSAMFFELEDGTSSPDADAIIDWAKQLYEGIEPRLIRIGDSEAREKLKSRHGLVLMPGLGRVEWLQVVHPDVYGDLYNPSELVAAPAYAAEIWEDGALFLRVYGDPKDWENEENISLANFIPGFLAGTANVKDGEKEKQNVRQIEKLWNRASKTAERAAETFKPPSPGETPAKAAAPKEEEPKATPEPEPEEPEVDDAPTEVVDPEQLAAAQAAAAAKEVPEVEPEPIEELEPEAIEEVEPEPVEEEVKPAAEAAAGPPSAADIVETLAVQAPDVKLDPGSVQQRKASKLKQTIYSALETTTSPPSKVFIAWGPDEDKLRLLDKLEDFAAFLQAEGVAVQDKDQNKIVQAVTTYHRPYLQYITSIAEIPQPALKDPRLNDFKAQVKAPYFDVSDETQQLHLWAYNPRSASLEEVLIRQFEDWPLTMEVKRHLLDLKAPKKEPEKKTEPKKADKTAEKAAPSGEKAEAEQKGKRQLIMLLILVLVLAIAAAVYVFYFDADYNNLWNY